LPSSAFAIVALDASPKYFGVEGLNLSCNYCTKVGLSPYQTKESLQVLGDLLDGYFPFILKGKYPNGVFLKVVDRLGERYSEDSTDENVVSLESKVDRDFKPPSKEEFLQKLPKSIIKNGKGDKNS
jgi:hypothetical protein